MQCISSVYCRRHLLCSRLKLWTNFGRVHSVSLHPRKRTTALNNCSKREKSDDTPELSSTSLHAVVISGLVNLVWCKIFPQVDHVSLGIIRRWYVLVSNSQARPGRNFSQPRKFLIYHLCTPRNVWCERKDEANFLVVFRGKPAASRGSRKSTAWTACK